MFHQTVDINSLPDELVLHIVSYAKDQPQLKLVSAYLNQLYKEIEKELAKDFFQEFLVSQRINLARTSHSQCIKLISLYALHCLPEIKDSDEKIASIGVLLLQLFYLMHLLTEKGLINFTTELEDVEINMQFHGDIEFTQTISTKRCINASDLAEFKNDAEDMIAFLRCKMMKSEITINPRLIRHFSEITKHFLKCFKEGLSDVQSENKQFRLFTFFLPNETSAEKIARQTNICVCLLESEMYKMGLALDEQHRCTIS